MRASIADRRSRATQTAIAEPTATVTSGRTEAPPALSTPLRTATAIAATPITATSPGRARVATASTGSR